MAIFCLSAKAEEAKLHPQLRKETCSLYPSYWKIEMILDLRTTVKRDVCSCYKYVTGRPVEQAAELLLLGRRSLEVQYLRFSIRYVFVA